MTDTAFSEILLLHPGAMGHAVAALLVEAGHRVTWVPSGRGPASAARAAAAGLAPRDGLAQALSTAELVLSVCPPHAALDLAASVGALGYRGAYLDANAVSPATARQVAARLPDAAVTDGGIVGPPPMAPDRTRLFLSGPGAARIAGLFAGTHLEPVPLGEDIGAASALKMAYAGWSKASAALLMTLRALARAEGVEQALLAEWARSQPGLARRDLTATLPKAWRFSGEMDEIAESLAANGLPRGFHDAASAVFDALAGFKDSPDPDLDAALATLGRWDQDSEK